MKSQEIKHEQQKGSDIKTNKVVKPDDKAAPYEEIKEDIEQPDPLHPQAHVEKNAQKGEPIITPESANVMNHGLNVEMTEEKHSGKNKSKE